MEIKQPIWHLKKIVCPVCDGQGRLEFSACPNCHLIVLVCEEEGSVFIDLNIATLTNVFGNIFNENLICPNCEKVEIQNFVNATSSQIRNLGFSEKEYE